MQLAVELARLIFLGPSRVFRFCSGYDVPLYGMIVGTVLNGRLTRHKMHCDTTNSFAAFLDTALCMQLSSNHLVPTAASGLHHLPRHPMVLVALLFSPSSSLAPIHRHVVPAEVPSRASRTHNRVSRAVG